MSWKFEVEDDYRWGEEEQGKEHWQLTNRNVELKKKWSFEGNCREHERPSKAVLTG